ncbi:hypothetical protein FEM48_Zijuj02G0012000 [Ziziphus jujuba var. spinosa]|uniref:FBD domain-containing protein n=1 Tax=Ziziphus jujuba var. spinosa TaxID=714518 RepID=A0A978VSR3_ZIZJJ|nr:hypothetical protein FEM48_Zijuj02G0012000 [Ziziphus jujuba var. spinosa]
MVVELTKITRLYNALSNLGGRAVWKLEATRSWQHCAKSHHGSGADKDNKTVQRLVKLGWKGSVEVRGNKELATLLGYPCIKEDMEPTGAFWKPAKRPLDCLKEVEVTGYSGPPGCDELIFFFIDNAVSLEKIIVNPREYVAWPCIKSTRSRFKKSGRDHAMGYMKEKIPKPIEFLCH